jgi:alpha-glucosidase
MPGPPRPDPGAALAAPPDAPPALGPLTAVTRRGDAVTVEGAVAARRLRFLADGVLEIRLAPDGLFHDHPSYALDPAAAWPGPSALAVEEGEGAVAVRSAALEARVDRATGALRIATSDGRVVLDEAAAPAWAPGRDGSTNGAAGVALATRLRPGERLFGLGDRASAPDRRGGRFTLWNTDAFEFERGTDPLYKAIPFVLGVVPGEKAGEGALAYGLFVDTPARSVFDCGHADGDRLCVEAGDGALTSYVLHAPTLLGVLQAFARLTGRTPMWPKWALGYHQSRYSYRTAAEVQAVADQLRARRIPCDALYLDIHYMDGYRVFTWDRAAFPDPPGLLARLEAAGFRVVAIVDPGVKADDPAYPVALDGLAEDAFCRYPHGDLFTGEVWPGTCYLPDFTSPRARRWWGRCHRGLLDAGVAGIWCDMNEPALFTEPGSEVHAATLPDAVRHDGDGRPAAHRALHNAYGSLMARATYEGLHRLRPARRPFTITRAAYAGAQRYATAWTGDNTSTWDHLRLALEQCLGLNASGVPFVGADVGGFLGAPTGELLARWTQLGALTPLFRNHSGLDTPPQEPWAFGPEVERVCREAIELRYRLLPYLYTALHHAAAEGLPMLAPLALVHPDDEAVRRDAPDGFYVGDRLLACPVLDEGQAEAEVYLPDVPGGWFDFRAGARHPGGAHLRVATPLDALPLYVRAGTVLPLGPVVQHTREPVEHLTLRVYPAEGAFTSVLYDDAGDGWDFARGGFYRCVFRGEGEGGTLRVEAEVEGAFAPPWARWDVEVYGERAPRAVEAAGQPVDFDFDGTCARFSVPVSSPFTVRY